MATIRQIKELILIENADKIELAKVGGASCSRKRIT